MFAKVVALVAAVIAGAALAVSLLHAGPRGPAGTQGQRGMPGPRGSQGSTGQDAEVAHLGVCEEQYTQTSGTTTWVTSVSIYSPVLTAGVPGCPSGSFVSVVPAQG